MNNPTIILTCEGRDPIVFAAARCSFTISYGLRDIVLGVSCSMARTMEAARTIDVAIDVDDTAIAAERCAALEEWRGLGVNIEVQRGDKTTIYTGFFIGDPHDAKRPTIVGFSLELSAIPRTVATREAGPAETWRDRPSLL